MKDKDRVILAVYVGVQGMSDKNKNETMEEVTKMVRGAFDDSVITLVFPSVLFIGYHVDCINPKYLTKEEFDKLNKAVEKILLKAEEAE